MAICKKCGASVADGQKYCGNCGAEMLFEENSTQKGDGFRFVEEQMSRNDFYAQYVPKSLKVLLIIITLWMIIGLIVYIAFLAWAETINLYVVTLVVLYIVCINLMLIRKDWKAPAFLIIMDMVAFFVFKDAMINSGLKIPIAPLIAFLNLLRIDIEYRKFLRTGEVHF